MVCATLLLCKTTDNRLQNNGWGGGSLIIDTLISTIVDQISLAAIKQVYKDTLISTSKYLRQLLKIALQVIYGILTSSMLLSLERANA